MMKSVEGPEGERHVEEIAIGLTLAEISTEKIIFPACPLFLIDLLFSVTSIRISGRVVRHYIPDSCLFILLFARHSKPSCAERLPGQGREFPLWRVAS